MKKLYLISLLLICLMSVSVLGYFPTIYNDELVKDIYPGSEASSPYTFIEHNSKLYFRANHPTYGYELFVYDNVTDNVSLVSDINPSGSSYVALGAELEGDLYFLATDGTHGFELFRYNGTNSSLVQDFNTGSSNGASGIPPIELNNSIYYVCNNGTTGSEFCTYDGTNIEVVADINPGSGSSNPYYFAKFDGKIYFPANNGISGVEPFVYDGNSVSLLADLNNGTGNSNANYFTEYNGNFYFSAVNSNAATLSNRLHMINGSSAFLIPSSIHSVVNLIVYGDKLYFAGVPDNESVSYRMYSYDGNLIELVSDDFSQLQKFAVLDNSLFIKGEIKGTTTGVELLVYDGTDLSLVKDFINGSSGSYPDFFYNYDNALYFKGNDGVLGYELYKLSIMNTCSLNEDCNSSHYCYSSTGECLALKSNGQSCTTSEECDLSNCEADLDTSGSVCTASTSCNYLDTERTNTYSTCYSNDDYTCNSGTWGSVNCASDCGFYPSVDTCTGSSCIACVSSCTVNGDCDLNAHCDANVCVSDVATGQTCSVDGDCTSDYCVNDYDGGQFCSDDSTSCQHDGVDYNNAATSDGYTCQSGVWNDITPPVKLTLANVDGDSSSAYWDTSDNGATILQLTSGESGIACRASTSNTNYDAMSSYVECTGSTTVSCSLSLSQSASYTYYIACEDAAGNDQTGGNIESVSFGVDWSEPTTYVSGYGSVYVPGHTVTINEADNTGTTVTITTYECHPTTGCTPTTVIDDSETVSFSDRGTNYIRWYSTDAAGNSQNVSEAIVTINTLPVVQDVGYVLGGYTGKTGNSVTFFCDASDLDATVGSSFDAYVYVRTTGSGTWNKVDGATMSYNGATHDFTYDYSLSDTYPTEFDVACVVTDDLGEDSTQYSENNVFTVVNTAPLVSDITIQANVSRFDIMRIYCDGSDSDGDLESSLTATIYLKTNGSGYPAWDRVNGGAMAWDGTHHYYDYFVFDYGNQEYDARCVLSDGSDSTTRDEFKFESNGVVTITDDFDNDGVSDIDDKVEGTASDINTTLDLNFLVGGVSVNDTTGTQNVSFEDNSDSVSIIEFEHDFTEPINLKNVTVKRQKTNRGGLLIKGLKGKNKTVKVDKILSLNRLCVKNQEVDDLSEITPTCNGINEILFTACNEFGQTISGITCDDKGTYYEISGLTNSAIIENGDARLETYVVGTLSYLNEQQISANYTNVTSGGAISDGSCDVYFSDWDNWTAMTFTSFTHTFNRIFAAGPHSFNVSCTSATFDDLQVLDTVVIVDPAAVPEWSDLAYVLIIVGALGAMYSRREN